MSLKSILSLAYPVDIETQEVFQARAKRFFSYSTSNMMSLIYGALLIALILYVKGTSVGSITIYFLITASIALCVFFISKYVEINRPQANRLSRFVLLRVFLGCMIGTMYGAAVFLLPLDTAATGSLFLIIIYVVAIAVAIFQYSIFPLYYVLFNLSIFLPLIAYFLLNFTENFTLIILMLVSCAVVFISKGLKISKSEINVIELNLRLKKEVAEHIVTRTKLQKIALYDDLTKVANRTLFNDSAEAMLEKAKNNTQPFTLLYIDLNEFKYINDNFGHNVGDQVLIEAAGRIRKRIRASDLVARMGGDEFVVILENYDVEVVKNDLIESICSGLNKDLVIDGVPIKLRASIGVAGYPSNGESLSELLGAADRKMYKQKSQKLDS